MYLDATGVQVSKISTMRLCRFIKRLFFLFILLGIGVPTQAYHLPGVKAKELADLWRERKFEQVIESANNLEKEYQHPRDRWEINLMLGLAYRGLGRYDESLLAYSAALAFLKEANTIPDKDLERNTLLNNMALVFERLGRYDDAEATYRELTAFDGSTRALALNALAMLYKRQNRFVEAQNLLEQALPEMEEHYGSEHHKTAVVLGNLANLYGTLGRHQDSVRMHNRALLIKKEQLGPLHPDVGLSLINLGMHYKDQENYIKAEKLVSEGLAIYEESLGSEHPNVGRVLTRLGGIYHYLRRLDDAEASYRRAWKILEDSLGPRHPDVAHNYEFLSSLYYWRGNLIETLNFARRSSAIYRHRFVSGGSELFPQDDLGAQKRIFRQHLQVAIEKELPGDRAELIAEAFEILQLTQSSATANAVAQMARLHSVRILEDIFGVLSVFSRDFALRNCLKIHLRT